MSLQKSQKLKKREELYFPSAQIKKRAWVKDKAIYKKALKDPVKFWEELAKELHWQKKWQKGFEHNPPYFKWFVGGKINITYNIFERNFQEWEKIPAPHRTCSGAGKNKIALIWEPEPLNEKPRALTYQELFREVNKFANALKKLGVKKGERIGIYLPMIPEVIVSMLACARIGAVHTIIFSAFSPAALKVRLQDTEAKILITADGYYRRGKIINLKTEADEGVKETKVEKVIVIKRARNEVPWQEERDIWYESLIKNEKEFAEPETMDSEDLLFLLATSGSTGRPKQIIHTCGGYTVQAYWTGKWIFDLKPKDILWCTSDPGWITGHSYTVYSPLLNGITTLMFEGAPDWPTPDRWAQIIEKHSITIFYTAPTAIRMFEKLNGTIAQKYEFKTLRLLGSVGEPIDEDAWNWYFKNVGKERCPLVDTWWQTETGGILITSLPGIGPFKPAFTGLPFPGVKVDILAPHRAEGSGARLDEKPCSRINSLRGKGKSCPPGKVGDLVVLAPFSPGMLRGIYKDPEKYKATYWSQYGEKTYFTSDGALRDKPPHQKFWCGGKQGLIRIVGRVDDVIKVAGHRLTTGELEAAVNLHPEITECAVIGIPDEIKGEVPVAFIVYKEKKSEEELKKEVVEQIRKQIGPIALPKEVYIVEDLPKTRSGKLMRRILKRLFTGEELGDLSTLANPESVERIVEEIRRPKQ